MASTWLFLILFGAVRAVAAAAYNSVAAAIDDPPCLDSVAMLKLNDSVYAASAVDDSLTSWRNPNPCNWTGISCEAGRVVKVDIRYFGIGGSLTADGLGSLPNLREFYDGNNALDPYPSGLFSHLSNLEILSLVQNNIIDPPPWIIPESLKAARKLKSFTAILYNIESSALDFFTNESFPVLNYLDLSNNKLSWPLSSNNLPETLETLKLEQCGLSGEMPNLLAHLPSLKNLDMRDNGLSGVVPEFLGDLHSLQYLDLSHNNLTGPLPESLGNIISLQEVYLLRNQLTGAIPPTISRLTNVNTLYLSNNQLSGKIPNLSNLTSMSNFLVDNNILTGPVPESLLNLSKLFEVNLANNNLSGTIPENFKHLKINYTLDLSNNQLSGCVPYVLTPANEQAIKAGGNAGINGTCPRG